MGGGGGDGTGAGLGFLWAMEMSELEPGPVALQAGERYTFKVCVLKRERASDKPKLMHNLQNT